MKDISIGSRYEYLLCELCAIANFREKFVEKSDFLLREYKKQGQPRLTLHRYLLKIYS